MTVGPLTAPLSPISYNPGGLWSGCWLPSRPLSGSSDLQETQTCLLVACRCPHCPSKNAALAEPALVRPTGAGGLEVGVKGPCSSLTLPFFCSVLKSCWWFI